MDKVQVIAAGMTTFGPQPDVEVHELARRAVWEAIVASGVEPGVLRDAPGVVFAGHAYLARASRRRRC